MRRAEGPFGIPARVYWKGKGGAGMANYDDLLNDLRKRAPPPDLLIFHLGTNDLVTIDEFALRQQIAVMLRDCAWAYPTSTIVWSDMLPRVFYMGARSQSALERKRRTINRWAASQCKAVQALCVHHPQFIWSEVSLFSYDGVHLSSLGNQLFRSNLRAFIVSNMM